MFYAVIDTNVLVSAMLAKKDTSATVIILDKVLSREIVPLFNEEIIQEYQEVLSRERFDFDPNQVRILIEKFRLLGEDTARTPFPEPMIDEKDRVLYEVSLTEEESYLVTGNLKHFPVTPKVVTPAQMLEIVGKR